MSTSSFPADVCHGFTDVVSLTFMVALQVASPHWAIFPQSLTMEALECTDAHTGLQLVFLQINSYVHQSPFSNTLLNFFVCLVIFFGRGDCFGFVSFVSCIFFFFLSKSSSLHVWVPL